MEAKDTVMSQEDQFNCSLISEFPYRKVKDVIRDACNRQAAISFAAGKAEGQLEQAALDQLNFDRERLVFWDKIAKAKQEGIMEVVKFIEGGGLGRYAWSEDTKTKWQTFKESKGIGGGNA